MKQVKGKTVGKIVERGVGCFPIGLDLVRMG